MGVATVLGARALDEAVAHGCTNGWTGHGGGGADGAEPERRTCFGHELGRIGVVVSCFALEPVGLRYSGSGLDFAVCDAPARHSQNFFAFDRVDHRGAVVLTFFGLLLPAIDKINAIEFAIGSQVFKGANIVTGVMMAVVALTIAGQLSELVAILLKRYASKQNLQANDALILTRFFSFIIFTLTVVGVLVESGIDLTTLAAFGGAMGIGLGFGLQEFVVNFFSGLSVLLERALKVGDYVTINQITGRVVHMSSRAVVVRDRVGTESLIPNSSIMKGILQNHTMSNAEFRMFIPLRIADVSDYPRARSLILQVLEGVPQVLQTPAAHVLITEICGTEAALDVSFWINDWHDGQNELVSELLFAMAMRLRAEGVPLASDSAQALLASMA